MNSYTVNCSILLDTLPLLERPAAAREAGFTGVEFWWPFPTAVPSDAEVDRFVSAITEAGVQLTGLNFFAGDMPAGDRGLVSIPSRKGEFTDNIDVVVGIGDRLGCKAFNALYGLRPEGVSEQESDELGVQNLTAAGRAVAKIGGIVLLEPVSGAPSYSLKTADQTFAILDRVAAQGVENVRFLADFFHLSVNGDDVPAVIAAHAGDFGHIQIADAPGRGEPGTGQLALSQWIADSRSGGYEDWIGLEYKTAAADPFAWLPREQRGQPA